MLLQLSWTRCLRRGCCRGGERQGFLGVAREPTADLRPNLRCTLIRQVGFPVLILLVHPFLHRHRINLLVFVERRLLGGRGAKGFLGWSQLLLPRVGQTGPSKGPLVLLCQCCRLLGRRWRVVVVSLFRDQRDSALVQLNKRNVHEDGSMGG